MNKLKFRAVLFDLDGTLLNTLEDLANAVNTGLLQLGFPRHEREEYRYFVGEGREVMARLALPPANRAPDLVDRLCAIIDAEYTAHWADHTRPYPGIAAMLDEVAACGLAMAILSNKPQEFTVSNVAGLLSRWHFAVVAGSLPGRPNKPDCTRALEIAAQLQIPADAFLYLGDSGIDMQTATAAGMYPVGALWGFRDAAELNRSGARKLISQPTQLLELL